MTNQVTRYRMEASIHEAAPNDSESHFAMVAPVEALNGEWVKWEDVKRLLYAEPASNLGPREPNNDMVICPNCTCQFVAIPVNVQKRLREPETACNCGKPACVPESEWKHVGDCPAFHVNRT